MPSNLLIPLDGHASFLEVGTFEYGVLAEFVLDGYHGVLQGFFLALLVLGSRPSSHSTDDRMSKPGGVR